MSAARYRRRQIELALRVRSRPAVDDSVAVLVVFDQQIRRILARVEFAVNRRVCRHAVRSPSVVPKRKLFNRRRNDRRRGVRKRYRLRRS